LKKILKYRALDVESLCVLSGKCVWSIQIDLTLVNNDGNLIDAFYLSAILSLLHFKKPQISVENLNKIVLYTEEEKKPHPLSIHHIPIAFTFAFFNNSSELIMDPTVSTTLELVKNFRN
jgi:exosome complex component RRP45